MGFDIVYLCYQSSRQSRLWKIPNEGLDAFSFTPLHNSQVHALQYWVLPSIFAEILHSPPHYCRDNYQKQFQREENNPWSDHGGSCSLQGGRGEGDHQDWEDRGPQSHPWSRYAYHGIIALLLIVMFGQDWMTAWTRDRSARGWSARQRPGELPGWWWRWWKKVGPLGLVWLRIYFLTSVEIFHPSPIFHNSSVFALLLYHLL